MSDEIRTPKGRTLLRKRDDAEGRFVYADPWGEMRVRARGGDIIGLFGPTCMIQCDTMAEALSWLDARADETVAALLPPGAIVVSEERARELARVLCEQMAKSWEYGGNTDAHMDEFLSALRAGAKS